jgi:ubiquinone/menaquinone biosynthesis C-methylase UbiE
MRTFVTPRLRSAQRYLTGCSLVLVLLGPFVLGCTSVKRIAYEGFGRDRWQYTDRVLNSLGIQPGDHVADLGSGTGYFTLPLAEAVGPNGKVYAVDVDGALNEYVVNRATKAGHQNVDAILAKHDDPLLPLQGVELVFTCNTYHHLNDRIAYFKRVCGYLRPGGRVAIIDFDGRGWLERLLGHWTRTEIIQSEMEAAGYALLDKYNFLSRQSFLVFARNQPCSSRHTAQLSPASSRAAILSTRPALAALRTSEMAREWKRLHKKQ